LQCIDYSFVFVGYISESMPDAELGVVILIFVWMVKEMDVECR